jgi:hypothetical protein
MIIVAKDFRRYPSQTITRVLNQLILENTNLMHQIYIKRRPHLLPFNTETFHQV